MLGVARHQAITSADADDGKADNGKVDNLLPPVSDQTLKWTMF